MNLTEEIKAGLNIALNEATLLGVEVSPHRRIAGATLSVLTLPEAGPSPDDSRRQFLFQPVGRIAASLRLGHWDDPKATVIPFTIEELLERVKSFGGLPIYGWKFFDLYVTDLPRWADRLSLDWRGGDNGLCHSISLFQWRADRHLALCIWFDNLTIRDPLGHELALEEVVAGGRRWWDAFYAQDPRTTGRGMYPLK